MIGLGGKNFSKANELIVKSNQTNLLVNLNNEKTETQNVSNVIPETHSNCILKSINNDLKKVVNCLENFSRKELVYLKWNYTARVIDRIFFMITLTYSLVVLLYFLLSI